jgi:hypothetical protein
MFAAVMVRQLFHAEVRVHMVNLDQSFGTDELAREIGCAVRHGVGERGDWS